MSQTLEISRSSQATTNGIIMTDPSFWRHATGRCQGDMRPWLPCSQAVQNSIALQTGPTWLIKQTQSPNTSIFIRHYHLDSGFNTREELYKIGRITNVIFPLMFREL